MVDQCKYVDDRDSITDRIIQDVLIIRCSSSHAKDKIIMKGSAVSLKEMLKILQTEESTTKTLSTIRADTQKIHYARYNQAPRVESRNQDNPLHSRNPTPNLRMDLCVTDVERHSQRDMTKCARIKLPNTTPARWLDIIQSVASKLEI